MQDGSGTPAFIGTDHIYRPKPFGQRYTASIHYGSRGNGRLVTTGGALV